MDYLPGNNCEEWQFLGDSENAIPYQLVTIYNQMHWNKFELENFRAACGKFSGKLFDFDFTGKVRLHCTGILKN